MSLRHLIKHSHGRVTRSRIFALAVLAVLAAIACILLFLPRETSNGPLQLPPHYGYTKTLQVGDTFTDAFNVLWLKPNTRMQGRIIAVEPVWNSPDVKTDHVLVALPSRPGPEIVPVASYQTGHPTDARLGQLVAAAGAPIMTEQRAGLGTQLLFSIHVDAPGHYLRRGYYVTYEVAGRRYRDYVATQITLCTPTYTVAGVCPTLGEGAD